MCGCASWCGSCFAFEPTLCVGRLVCPSSILQRAELAFPGEGVGDDGCEIIELRPPPQQLSGAVGLRHDPGRIAGSAASAIDTKVHARHAFDRVDDVKHGESVAVAAVERR